MDKWPLNTRRKIIFETFPPCLRSSHLKVLMSGHIGWRPPRGGIWLWFGWVCAARVSKFGNRFKKIAFKMIPRSRNRSISNIPSWWAPVTLFYKFSVIERFISHDNPRITTLWLCTACNTGCNGLICSLRYIFLCKFSMNNFKWLLIIWWAFIPSKYYTPF